MPDETRDDDYWRMRLHEAEHRYANSFQMISGLARRKQRNAETEDARERLGYISELVELLGHLNATLLASGEADLCERLRQTCQRWQRLCNGHIAVVVECKEPVVLSGHRLTNASLIAHELVLNAIKHAFPGSRRGTIRISVDTDRDGMAVLSVRDDGIGCADPAETSSVGGSGHGLVDALAEALDGTLEHGTPPGGGHAVTVRWPP